MSEEKQKRPKACVGVMILKDRKILIGRRKGTATHGPGEYSLPGGHIEAGESFLKATERETLEEAGVKIKNLKFLCVANTEAYKGYQAVLVNFVADWESGEPKDFEYENIGQWQWSDIDNLPEPLFTPTKLLIDSYKTGKNYYDLVYQ
jgi:8-oxo-dGTP diphosphatase